MKSTTLIWLFAFIAFWSGCNKSKAPYIDSIVGTYKVSGTITLDSTHIRTVTDTLVTITKLDNSTIGFMEGGCDLTFWAVSLAFYQQYDTKIFYSKPQSGSHDPNGASIQFPNPPNGTFYFASSTYCSSRFCSSELYGTKVP